MTIQVSTVNTVSDSFGQWIAKTNQAIVAVNNYSVTVNSNTAVGNAYITGMYHSNSLFANTVLTVGGSSANITVNASFVTVQSSPTQNVLISSAGMVIGSTSYTQTLMTIGNTSIRGSNVSTNSLYLTTQAVLGNTTLSTTSAYADNLNTRVLTASGNATFGDNEANTYVSRNGIIIYSQPLGTWIVNTNITSTSVSTVDVYANNIHGNLIGSFAAPPNGAPIVFTANMQFSGLYNYFDNGLTSNGNIEVYGNDGVASHYFATSYWPTSFPAYPSVMKNSNAAFVYQASDTSVWLSRNIVDGNRITYGSSADVLHLGTNVLQYYTYVNGTAGVANLFTLQVPLSISTSSGYISSNNFSLGNTTFTSNVTVYGSLGVAGLTSGGVTLKANTTGSSYTLTLPSITGTASQVLTADGTGKTYWAAVPLPGNSTIQQLYSLGVGTPASGILGEIRATNNISAYYSSDARLKTNVTNIEHALDKVMFLNGVEFDWSDQYLEDCGGEDGYFVRKHDVGVIAQEVEAILPEIVATRDDGFKAVKYDRLVSLLIEAIKELKQEVDELKKK